MDLVVGKLASDTLLLDVREVTLIADYFVICTGHTDRQVQAICEQVAESLEKKAVKPLSVEGDGASGWVLMDYSSIILHIFTPTVRRYYDLEGFWGKARTVLRIE